MQSHQVIGLIKSLGYTLEEALSFGDIHDYNTMLDYMYAEAYDRLSGPEKKMLHVLPVFGDPAPEEAIGAASAISGAQRKVGLQRLYKAFLVNRVDPAQYELLPFARQFLRTRQGQRELIDSYTSLCDFLGDAHRRLARHYIEYLNAMNFEEQLDFQRRAKNNILGVMEWCYNNAEWQLVVDLMSRMGRLFAILRYLNQMILWGQRSMQACEHLGHAAQKEWFHVYCVAWPYSHLDTAKREQARAILQQSLHVAQAHDYRELEALVLRNQGRLAVEDGDFETALHLLEKCMALWRATDGERHELVGSTLSAIGEAKLRLGQMDAAQRDLEEAHALRRQAGDADGVVITLSLLALVYYHQGDAARARDTSDESIRLAAIVRRPARIEAIARMHRAELEELTGDIPAAQRQVRAAGSTYSALGMTYWVEQMEAYSVHLEQRLAQTV